MLGVVIGLSVLFQWASGGLFLSPMNVTNLVFQGAYLIVLAPAMLMVMVTGRLDLSVGSIAAFASAVLAVLLLDGNVPVIVAVPGVLLLGAVVGALQGYLIARLRIPMFITTLSGMLIWRGLTLVILKGETRAPLATALTRITTGFVPAGLALALATVGVLGLLWRRPFRTGSRLCRSWWAWSWSKRVGLLTGMVVASVTTVLLMMHRGVPVVVLIVAIPAMATAFLLERTVFGRYLYACGAAPKTARFSGVRNERVLLLVYLNNGLMAALAGVFVAGRLNAVTPKAGTSFELEAITACLIGGASMVGGVGRIGPVLLGSILIGVLNNGLSLTGIGGETLIKAGIMLAAGYADTMHPNHHGVMTD